MTDVKIKKESSLASSSSKATKAKGKDALVVELTKPGQRYPMESPGSGDFVFYQTLYKENPRSNMALVWCIEHGVFSHEEAGALLKQYQIAKKELLELNRSGSGKGASSGLISGRSKNKKRKVTVQLDAEVDAGVSVTMAEGIGTMHGM